ncbi:MAG: hypothetical protein A3G30_03970 [Chlamydiae bacterium RIFCSPLOWO2_12_FULL_49_12]|nr:MAG: hypothetical protein A3G30_03970 [Chlamydiae bacterium RIFCSPLOWO2_12_FULL_49_12]
MSIHFDDAVSQLSPAYSFRINRLLNRRWPEEGHGGSLQWVFEEITTGFSHQSALLSQKRTISVLTYVLSDGLGDWYHGMTAVNIIAQALPHWNVQFVVQLSIKHKNQESLSFPNGCETFLFYDDRKEPVSPAFYRALQHLRESDVILETPVPFFGDLTGQKSLLVSNSKGLMKKVILMEEYDDMSPLGKSMGVGLYSHGIALSPFTGERGFEYLENKGLKRFLLDGAKKNSHHFCYGYLPKQEKEKTDERHMLAFITATLALFEESGKEWIDLVGPFDSEEIQINSYLLEFLKTKDVQELQCINKDPQRPGWITTSIPFEKEGRKIRLINPFPISHHDARLLTALSENVVGCTGDMSLSEALSEGLLPFYQIRSHKESFFRSLHDLAAETFSGDSNHLVAYLSALINWNPLAPGDDYLHAGAKLGRLLRHPETQAQMRTFSALIKTHYPYQEILIGLIAGKLFQLSSYSAIKQIYEQFSSCEIDEKTTVQALKTAMGLSRNPS